MDIRDIQQRILDYKEQYQAVSVSHGILRAIWEISESNHFDDHMRVDMIKELVKMANVHDLYKENLFVVVEIEEVCYLCDKPIDHNNPYGYRDSDGWRHTVCRKG